MLQEPGTELSSKQLAKRDFDSVPAVCSQIRDDLLLLYSMTGKAVTDGGGGLLLVLCNRYHITVAVNDMVFAPSLQLTL